MTQKLQKLKTNMLVILDLTQNLLQAQANFITKKIFDAKIIELQNNIKKLQTFDSSYFRGKSHFEEDGAQNCLIFQPIIRYFKVNAISILLNIFCHGNLDYLDKGLSAETIKPPTTCDNNLTPTINYYYAAKIRVKSTGSCLKQPKILHTHGKVVNIYTDYELGASGSNNSNPTLKNCSFGAVSLTKNADIDKYGHSGYGTVFDRRSSFSFPGGGFGQNI